MTSNILRGLAATTAALIVYVAATLWWQNKRLSDIGDRLDQLPQPEESDVSAAPTLSEAGENMRAEYRERLKINSPTGGLTQADECSAYHLARQQSEQLALREEFIRSSKADGHGDQEIDSSIALHQKGDMPYALYVVMMCGNGQKPQSYSLYLK